MILLAKIQINDREIPSLLEYFSKRYRKSLRKKDCHAEPKRSISQKSLGENSSEKLQVIRCFHAASALREILDFSPYGRRPKGSDTTFCQDDNIAENSHNIGTDAKKEGIAEATPSRVV